MVQATATGIDISNYNITKDIIYSKNSGNKWTH